MLGKWTRKVVELICVNRISNYTLLLTFGVSFSLIGLIASSMEFRNIIIFLRIYGNTILEYFSGGFIISIISIFLFLLSPFCVMLIYLLNVYIFFWVGVKFGNIIGGIWSKETFGGKKEKAVRFLNKRNAFFIFNLLLFSFILFILIKGILIYHIWEGKRLPVHGEINLAFVREERKGEALYCYLSKERKLKKIYHISPERDIIWLNWLLFEDKLFFVECSCTQNGVRKGIVIIDCKNEKIVDVEDVIGRSNLERVMDVLNVKNEDKIWKRCRLVNIGKKYNYFLYDLDASAFKGTLLIERRSDGELIRVKGVSCCHLDISPDERYIVYSLRGENCLKNGKIYLFDIEKREKIFLCEGEYPFFYRGSQEIVYRYSVDRTSQKVVYRDIDLVWGGLMKYDLRKKEFSIFINPLTRKPYSGELLKSESAIVSDRECLYMLNDYSFYDLPQYTIVELNLPKGKYEVLVGDVISYAVGRSGKQ